MKFFLKVAVMLVIPGVLGVSNVASAQSTINLPSKVEAWLASPHADSSSEAFRHWDEDGEIPTACAACHSSTGFMDYIGADGSAAGQVDMAAAPRTVVECAACHSATASTMDSATFPSGMVIANLGSSATCSTCHQGRASSNSVNAKTAGLEEDTPNAELGFINVHYRVAAATLFGTEAKGAYEYEGHVYDGKFVHVPGLDSCTTCHNPHSLKVAPENCVSCHKVDILAAIRTSTIDFDGNGNTTEGVAAEINTLHAALEKAIQAYANEVVDKPIIYAPGVYPYFFNDDNANGVGEPDETIYPNSYKSWTPRLLKAAYNYQFVAGDPGAYAHNPRYTIQILIDSIADLATKVALDMPQTVRP